MGRQRSDPPLVMPPVSDKAAARIIAAPATRPGMFGNRWFTLAVLTLMFSVGFVDRQVLNLLVQPIKTSFGLDDLEISLLQGAAFSVAYLLMSPVFGRLVDVSGRRNILLSCLLVWSGFTALCGMSRGFGGLFAARSVVGAAEAGLTPAAWSMLSDTFDDKQLPRALSIYNIGPYVGGGIALLLGGAILKAAEGWDMSGEPLLSGMEPWQLTLVVIGALGLVCALPLLLVQEPMRRGGSTSDTQVTMKQALQIIGANRRFYGLFYVGMAFSIIPIYAFPAWLPALATRQFHIPLTQVGLNYGIITLVTGTAGVLAGPTVAGWIGRLGVRDQNLRLCVITNAILLILAIALFFRPSYLFVLIVGGIANFFYSMPMATCGAALQTVTPNRMRGLITSIYIVIVTIMGLGVAPVMVAVFTEHVFHDEARVGDSLAIVCGLAALGGAVVIWLTLSAYRKLLNQPIALAAAPDTVTPTTA